MTVALLDYDGTDIRMYADSEVERTKRLGACAKEPETVSFLESLPFGSVFFDLGANVGSYSLLAAALGLKVVAFEASTPNFARLVANFELNDLAAELIPHPLWSKLEMIEFCYSSREPGAALHSVNGHSPDREMKHAFPLDWWVFEAEKVRLPQPEYLKLDVDGCELEVLQGASRTLRAVQGLLVETDRSQPSHERLGPLLAESGFSVASVHPHGESPVANVLYARER